MLFAPGPVDTEFNNACGVKFSVKPLKSEYVAKYAVDNMLRGKLTIVPSFTNKAGHVFSKIIPSKLLSNVTYNIQKGKMN